MAVRHYKQEYAPLLPQGFYELSIESIRELCVSTFPPTSCRADIMAGFEVIFERLVGLGFTGFVWMDGSFLTKKIEPDDIDFIVLTPADFYDAGTEEQKYFLDWLINNDDDPKKSFRCHTDVVLVYPEDHPLRSFTVDNWRHWEEDVYGYSVVTREPKGIVAVIISPVALPTTETDNETKEVSL